VLQSGPKELPVTASIFSIGAAILMGQAVFGLAFLVASIRERENRASLLGGLQLLIMICAAIAYVSAAGTGFYGRPAGSWVPLAALLYGILAYVVLVMRWGARGSSLRGTGGLVVGAVERFDERETVFARDQLQPGSEEYKAFYEGHPEYEDRDSARREMHGVLGSMGAMDRPYEKPNVAALSAQSLFPYLLSTPDRLKPRGYIDLAGGRPVHLPDEATTRVKGYARHIGADLVGITEIGREWVYSHRGMASRRDGEAWGQEISLDHRYAIVLATEMDFEMVRAAPHTASTVETMGNYARGAIISTMLASYIANLGYSAAAQHVSHYDVLLVPLAVDAGLGELGRHGYLMTKELGPRLRLAAVATDMPLVPDGPVDIGVQDFCSGCRKCAVCCPSKSIPMGPAEPYNGTLRWKLNADTCHDYWGKIGSDCNICMRVCPWSHAGAFPHRIIAESVSRNRMSRRFFTFMDDVFYGKKPGPGDAPSWARFRRWDASS